MADNATVRRVAQILSNIRRDPALPLGCAVIEPDEDDVCTWFVKLHYPGAAVEHVDIHVSFPADGLPPTLSVLQPRLVAPFIHHGALCSQDLMSTAWQLTKESVVLLLMAVHRSLDLGDPRSGVTLDAASRHYTAEERQRGQAHVRKAHEDEFRALASAAAVDAESPSLAAPLPPPVDVRDPEALMEHLQKAMEGFTPVPLVFLDDSRTVVVTTSDESLPLPPLHVVGPAPVTEGGPQLSVRFEAKSVVISATTAVSFENVKLTLQEGAVMGALELRHTHWSAAKLVVSGRGRLTVVDCIAEGNTDSSLFVLQHNATVTAQRTTLHSTNVAEANKKIPFIQTMNNSVLSLEDCVVEASMRDVCMKVLVDSTVSLERTAARAAAHAVLTIGGHVRGVGCNFTGAVKGEHHSILHLRDSAVQDAKYGFSSMLSSRLTLENCRATGTYVGCLVDAALGTLRDCSIQSTQAGLFVLNKSKCTVSQLSVGPDEGKTLAHGVELKDATLQIKDSDIRNTHAIGLLVLAGGVLDAEDLRINGCTKPVGEESSGMKLVSTGTCTLRRSSVCGFRFGIAGLKTLGASILCEECRVTECYVGLLADGCDQASFVRCSSHAEQAAVFVLNKSKCTVSQLSVGPSEGKTLAHGVEVKDATLQIKDSDIRNVNSIGLLARDGASLDAEDLRIDCSTKPTAEQSTGIKLQHCTQCKLLRVRVRSYFFALAALSCNGHPILFNECQATEAYVGFLADGCDQVSFSECTSRSAQAGLLVLNKSKCTVSRLSVGPDEGKTLAYGVEVRDATLELKDSVVENVELYGCFVSKGSAVELLNVTISLRLSRHRAEPQQWPCYVDDASSGRLRDMPFEFVDGTGELRSAVGGPGADNVTLGDSSGPGREGCSIQ